MIALMASLLLCANKRSYQNKNMQQRHLNRETYFKEQVNTAQEFYMDYIKKYVLLQKGIKVLEIGCGEGGNHLPFAQLGCEITGIDITPSRIEQAQQFFKAANYEGTFIATDFLKARAEDYGTFQLILIHDVIEHIEPKEQFIKHIKAFADKDTLIFWGFPAWQMPFGGHQQICKNTTGFGPQNTASRSSPPCPLMKRAIGKTAGFTMSAEQPGTVAPPPDSTRRCRSLWARAAHFSIPGPSARTGRPGPPEWRSTAGRPWAASASPRSPWDLEKRRCTSSSWESRRMPGTWTGF